METIGDNGYNLITKGVKDALDTSAAQPGAHVFTITAFCTFGNLAGLQARSAARF